MRGSWAAFAAGHNLAATLARRAGGEYVHHRLVVELTGQHRRPSFKVRVYGDGAAILIQPTPHRAPIAGEN